MKCLEPHDREIIKDHAIINSFICYFFISSKWVWLGDVLTHFFQTTYCSIFCSHFIKPESRQFIHINSWATKRKLRQFVKNYKRLFYQHSTFYFFLIPSFLPHLTHFFMRSFRITSTSPKSTKSHTKAQISNNSSPLYFLITISLT